MQLPPPILNDDERVKAVERLGLLDTLPEERFDRLTRLASSIFGCHFATITFIDAERQWIKSSVNLDLGESARELSFCAHTIAQKEVLVVHDTCNDERFRNHPYVTGCPHIRFYAGVQLMAEGQPVGALCVFDTEAKKFDETSIEQLGNLGKLVESELQRQQVTELSNQLEEYQRRLARTQKITRVRSAILEKVVNAVSLQDVLNDIVYAIENEFSEQICSILLLEDGKLKKGAAPSLPDFYNEAINGVEIGVGVGSCGNAAATNTLTVVEDISTHPFWASWKGLAVKAGVGSCWSQPIQDSKGQVIGTFAIYHKEKAVPSSEEIILIGQFAHIASIAVERELAKALI